MRYGIASAKGCSYPPTNPFALPSWEGTRQPILMVTRGWKWSVLSIALSELSWYSAAHWDSLSEEYELSSPQTPSMWPSYLLFCQRLFNFRLCSTIWKIAIGCFLCANYCNTCIPIIGISHFAVLHFTLIIFDII